MLLCGEGLIASVIYEQHMGTINEIASCVEQVHLFYEIEFVWFECMWESPLKD